MARYWARWYEPKADSWAKAKQAIAEIVGTDDAVAVIEKLKQDEFEIEWPFWEMPDSETHNGLVQAWKSGEAMSGAYCVICAVFDAPNEAAVRAVIGERESVDVDLKSEDWSPGDRFPMSSDQKAGT
jgi:hypothetical protein